MYILYIFANDLENTFALMTQNYLWLLYLRMKYTPFFRKANIKVVLLFVLTNMGWHLTPANNISIYCRNFIEKWLKRDI